MLSCTFLSLIFAGAILVKPATNNTTEEAFENVEAYNEWYVDHKWTELKTDSHVVFADGYVDGARVKLRAKFVDNTGLGLSVKLLGDVWERSGGDWSCASWTGMKVKQSNKGDRVLIKAICDIGKRDGIENYNDKYANEKNWESREWSDYSKGGYGYLSFILDSKSEKTIFEMKSGKDNYEHAKQWWHYYQKDTNNSTTECNMTITFEIAGYPYTIESAVDSTKNPWGVSSITMPNGATSGFFNPATGFEILATGPTLPEKPTIPALATAITVYNLGGKGDPIGFAEPAALATTLATNRYYQFRSSQTMNFPSTGITIRFVPVVQYKIQGAPYDLPTNSDGRILEEDNAHLVKNGDGLTYKDTPYGISYGTSGGFNYWYGGRPTDKANDINTDVYFRGSGTYKKVVETVGTLDGSGGYYHLVTPTDAKNQFYAYNGDVISDIKPQTNADKNTDPTDGFTKMTPDVWKTGLNKTVLVVIPRIGLRLRCSAGDATGVSGLTYGDNHDTVYASSKIAIPWNSDKPSQELVYSLQGAYVGMTEEQIKKAIVFDGVKLEKLEKIVTSTGGYNFKSTSYKFKLKNIDLLKDNDVGTDGAGGRNIPFKFDFTQSVSKIEINLPEYTLGRSGATKGGSYFLKVAKSNEGDVMESGDLTGSGDKNYVKVSNSGILLTGTLGNDAGGFTVDLIVGNAYTQWASNKNGTLGFKDNWFNQPDFGAWNQYATDSNYKGRKLSFNFSQGKDKNHIKLTIKPQATDFGTRYENPKKKWTITIDNDKEEVDYTDGYVVPENLLNQYTVSLPKLKVWDSQGGYSPIYDDAYNPHTFSNAVNGKTYYYGETPQIRLDRTSGCYNTPWPRITGFGNPNAANTATSCTYIASSPLNEADPNKNTKNYEWDINYKATVASYNLSWEDLRGSVGQKFEGKTLTIITPNNYTKGTGSNIVGGVQNGQNGFDFKQTNLGADAMVFPIYHFWQIRYEVGAQEGYTQNIKTADVGIYPDAFSEQKKLFTVGNVNNKKELPLTFVFDEGITWQLLTNRSVKITEPNLTNLAPNSYTFIYKYVTNTTGEASLMDNQLVEYSPDFGVDIQPGHGANINAVLKTPASHVFYYSAGNGGGLPDTYYHPLLKDKLKADVFKAGYDEVSWSFYGKVITGNNLPGNAVSVQSILSDGQKVSTTPGEEVFVEIRLAPKKMKVIYFGEVEGGQEMQDRNNVDRVEKSFVNKHNSEWTYNSSATKNTFALPYNSKIGDAVEVEIINTKNGNVWGGWKWKDKLDNNKPTTPDREGAPYDKNKPWYFDPLALAQLGEENIWLRGTSNPFQLFATWDKKRITFKFIQPNKTGYDEVLGFSRDTTFATELAYKEYGEPITWSELTGDKLFYRPGYEFKYFKMGGEKTAQKLANKTDKWVLGAEKVIGGAYESNGNTIIGYNDSDDVRDKNWYDNLKQDYTTYMLAYHEGKEYEIKYEYSKANKDEYSTKHGNEVITDTDADSAKPNATSNLSWNKNTGKRKHTFIFDDNPKASTPAIAAKGLHMGYYFSGWQYREAFFDPNESSRTRVADTFLGGKSPTKFGDVYDGTFPRNMLPDGFDLTQNNETANVTKKTVSIFGVWIPWSIKNLDVSLDKVPLWERVSNWDSIKPKDTVQIERGVNVHGGSASGYEYFDKTIMGNVEPGASNKIILTNAFNSKLTAPAGFTLGGWEFISKGYDGNVNFGPPGSKGTLTFAWAEVVDDPFVAEGGKRGVQKLGTNNKVIPYTAQNELVINVADVFGGLTAQNYEQWNKSAMNGDMQYILKPLWFSNQFVITPQSHTPSKDKFLVWDANTSTVVERGAKGEAGNVLDGVDVGTFESKGPYPIYYAGATGTYSIKADPITSTNYRVTPNTKTPIANTFSRPGYAFYGWRIYYPDGTYFTWNINNANGDDVTTDKKVMISDIQGGMYAGIAKNISTKYDSSAAFVPIWVEQGYGLRTEEYTDKVDHEFKNQFDNKAYGNVLMGEKEGFVESEKFKYEEGPRFMLGSDKLYRVGHNVAGVYFNTLTSNGGGLGTDQNGGKPNVGGVLGANEEHTYILYKGIGSGQTEYKKIKGKFKSSRTNFVTEGHYRGAFKSFTLVFEVSNSEVTESDITRWDIQIAPEYWKGTIIHPNDHRVPKPGTVYTFYIDFQPQEYKINYADISWTKDGEGQSSFAPNGSKWNGKGHLNGDFKNGVDANGGVYEDSTMPKPPTFKFSDIHKEIVGIPEVNAGITDVVFKSWHRGYDPFLSTPYDQLNPQTENEPEWQLVYNEITGDTKWMQIVAPCTGYDYVLAGGMDIDDITMFALWQDKNGTQVHYDYNLPNGALNRGNYNGKLPFDKQKNMTVGGFSNVNAFFDDQFFKTDLNTHGLSLAWVNNLDLDSSGDNVYEYTFLGWTEYAKNQNEKQNYIDWRTNQNGTFLGVASDPQMNYVPTINNVAAYRAEHQSKFHIFDNDPRYPVVSVGGSQVHQDRYFRANWHVRKVSVVRTDRLGLLEPAYVGVAQYGWGSQINMNEPRNGKEYEQTPNAESAIWKGWGDVFSATGNTIGGADFASNKKYSSLYYNFKGWAEVLPGVGGGVATSRLLTDNVPYALGDLSYIAMWTLRPEVMEIVLNNIKRIDRSTLSGLKNAELLALIGQGDKLLEEIKSLRNGGGTYNFNDFEMVNARGFDNNKIVEMKNYLQKIAAILNGAKPKPILFKDYIENPTEMDTKTPINTARLRMLRDYVVDYLESLNAGGITLIDKTHKPTEDGAHQNVLKSIVDDFDNIIRSNSWTQINELETRIYNLFNEMRTDNSTNEGASCVDENKNIIPVLAYGKLRIAYRKFDAIIREYNVGQLNALLARNDVSEIGLTAKQIRDWVKTISQEAFKYNVPFEDDITSQNVWENANPRKGEPWIWPVSKPVTPEEVDTYIEMAYRVNEYNQAVSFFTGLQPLSAPSASLSVPMTLLTCIQIQNKINLRQSDIYEFKILLEELIAKMVKETSKNAEKARVTLDSEGLPYSIPTFMGDPFVVRLVSIRTVFEKYIRDPNLYGNYDYFNPSSAVPSALVTPFIDFIQTANETIARIPITWNKYYFEHPFYNDQPIPTCAEIRQLVREAVTLTKNLNKDADVVADRGYAYTFGPNGNTSPIAVGSFGTKNNDPWGIALTETTRNKLLKMISRILDIEYIGLIKRTDASFAELYDALDYATLLNYVEQIGRENMWLLEYLFPKNIPQGDASNIVLAKLWETIYFTEEVLQYTEGTSFYDKGVDLIDKSREVANATNPPSTEIEVLKQVAILEDYLLEIMDLVPEGMIKPNPDADSINGRPPILNAGDTSKELLRLEMTVRILAEYPPNAALDKKLGIATEAWKNASPAATKTYLNNTVNELLEIIGRVNQEKIGPDGTLVEANDETEGTWEALPIGGRAEQLRLLEEYIYNARKYINENEVGERRTILLAALKIAEDKYQIAYHSTVYPVQQIWKTRIDLQDKLAEYDIVIKNTNSLGDKKSDGAPVGLIIFVTVLLLLVATAGGAFANKHSRQYIFRFFNKHPFKVAGIKKVFSNTGKGIKNASIKVGTGTKKTFVNAKNKVASLFKRKPKAPKTPVAPPAEKF